MKMANIVLLGLFVSVFGWVFYRLWRDEDLRSDSSEVVSVVQDKNENYNLPMTKNFSIVEFHSKDGTAVPKEYYGNIRKVMDNLEIIRAYFGGRPITILSGYRSPNHNDKVGGVKNSMHLVGKAVDFKVQGLSSSDVQEGVRHLINEGKIYAGGLGRYNSFTHYDIGNYRSWKG